MKQLTVTVLTFHELDKLVNDTWPAWQDRFSCVSVFEWANDSDHVVLDVTPWHPVATPDHYDRYHQDVLYIWSHGQKPHAEGVSSLLSSLCTTRTSIPQGHYVIRVSW